MPNRAAYMTPTMGAGWTDQRVELLKDLWGRGLSCSQIAKQLGGVTRNAVIGKVHRLGLAGRAMPTNPNRIARTRRAPPVATASPPRYVATAPEPSTVVIDFPATADPGPNACKWPIGDPQDPSFGFCGDPTSRLYCPKHQELAYQPPKPKPVPRHRREYWGQGFDRFGSE